MSPFCDSLVTCCGGVQNFRVGKSIAVTQTLPPVGFSKQRVVDRNLTGLSTSCYNHNLFVGSKLGYHPELVDQIRIVLTKLRRMDLSGTRPRMRTLLRHGINHQITTLIGTVLQRTALYRKGTLPNSQYHCIEDLSDELFSPTLPVVFGAPWFCLEGSSPRKSSLDNRIRTADPHWSVSLVPAGVCSENSPAKQRDFGQKAVVFAVL